MRALGLADALEARSTPVRRIDARTVSGHRIMDFGYADVAQGSIGWGVHRGTLFEILWQAVAEAAIPVRTGFDVRRLTVAHGGWTLHAATGEEVGPFDFVIGADGAQSRIRRLSGLATKDVGYPWGALWSVVDDPDGLSGGTLHQRYRDTRKLLGILPTGVAQASIFWSGPEPGHRGRACPRRGCLGG